MAASSETLRVLELYSGIGGMHCALAGSDIPFEVVMAADVNTSANIVYSHNFPKTPVNSSAIESITVKDFEELNVDMILMSPPCQPFTRVGKQKDTADVRTKSFLHVLEVLKKTEKRPDYLLLENVKGFECSESRQRLIETLKICEYNYQEFLLTPLQFGIPNSRLRYFLIAKKQPKSFFFESTDQVMSSVPECAKSWLSWKQNDDNQDSSNLNHGCACLGISGDTNGMNDIKYDQSTGGTKRTNNSNQTETASKRQKVDIAGEIVNEGDANDTTESNIDTKTADTETSCDSLSSVESDNIARSKCTDKIDGENERGHSSVSNVCLQNYGGNLRLPVTEEQKSFGSCAKLHHFLSDKFNDLKLFEDYLIAEKEFKRLVVMDIVNGCTRKTCCFTKRYGHYTDGAGSLVLMSTDVEAVKKASALKQTASEFKNRDEWGDKEFSIIRDLKLRYFTPREIANILCFPSTYRFPAKFTKRQLYMLLGNSLNVHIVSVLIKIMTAGDFCVNKNKNM